MRSSGAWPNNLPVQLTSFVGREREVEEAQAALAGTRLLTLTGPGGSGKTRLALELATASAESFPDGAWWVELAPLAEGDHAADALAGALGVRPLPGRTQTQAATERLADDRGLVVLDNCEHVLEAAADLCEAILRGCPNVAVMATSRVPLGVPGESDWRVPPLSLPDAHELFVERATKAYARFDGSGHNASTVTRVCEELDGLPLAIELAAARAGLLSVEQIADGLDDRFRLLTGGRRDASPRQRTLRASMDWSHALLSQEQRVLFRRLAVFAGRASLEAVEAVCAGDGLEPPAILDLTASLADASLVVVEQDGRCARYRLLETVRQYALELLVHAGELSTLRDRHVDYYVELSERTGRLINTPAGPQSIEVLNSEAANFQAAVDHAIPSRPEQALRMGVALTPWWRVTGQFIAGRRALAAALDAAASTPSALRARALWSCGFLARFLGDIPAALRYSRESLEIAESIGDGWTLAVGLVTVGGVRMFQSPAQSRVVLDRAMELARADGDPWLAMMVLGTLGRSYMLSDDFGDAEQRFTEVGLLMSEVGVEAVTHSAFGLAYCAMVRGDFDRSAELCDRALSAADDLGDSVTEALTARAMVWAELWQGKSEAGLARGRAAEARAVARGAFMAVPSLRIEVARAEAALGRLHEARDLLELVVAGGADSGWHYCDAVLTLGEVLRALGDVDGARIRASEGLELAEQMGVRSFTASSRELLARLAVEGGRWGEAEASLHDALSLRVEIGVPIWLPQTLEAMALVAGGLESFTEAARLLGAAERGRADLGVARSPLHASAVSDLESKLGTRLGADGLLAARQEGAAMALSEAVGWVRRARGTRKRPSAGWESLTPTEVQIVGLVAEGLTNPQVAARMFISRGTVKVHLQHVFQKLEVHSRSELTALAVRRVR